MVDYSMSEHAMCVPPQKQRDSTVFLKVMVDTMVSLGATDEISLHVRYSSISNQMVVMANPCLSHRRCVVPDHP